MNASTTKIRCDMAVYYASLLKARIEEVRNEQDERVIEQIIEDRERHLRLFPTLCKWLGIKSKTRYEAESATQVNYLKSTAYHRAYLAAISVLELCRVSDNGFIELSSADVVYINPWYVEIVK